MRSTCKCVLYGNGMQSECKLSIAQRAGMHVHMQTHAASSVRVEKVRGAKKVQRGAVCTRHRWTASIAILWLQCKKRLPCISMGTCMVLRGSAPLIDRTTH